MQIIVFYIVDWTHSLIILAHHAEIVVLLKNVSFCEVSLLSSILFHTFASYCNIKSLHLLLAGNRNLGSIQNSWLLVYYGIMNFMKLFIELLSTSATVSFISKWSQTFIALRILAGSFIRLHQEFLHTLFCLYFIIMEQSLFLSIPRRGRCWCSNLFAFENRTFL